MTGIPFGDPKHPWRPTTESARKAGLLGKAKSPWRLFKPPKPKRTRAR